MITRKEAQEYLLKQIDREIAERGEDYIFVAAPQPGKNTWTLAEYRKAVENDDYLENGGKVKPVDDMLKYVKWLDDHGRDVKDEDSWKELMG
jgi:hypothetical protein